MSTSSTTATPNSGDPSEPSEALEVNRHLFDSDTTDLQVHSNSHQSKRMSEKSSEHESSHDQQQTIKPEYQPTNEHRGKLMASDASLPVPHDKIIPSSDNGLVRPIEREYDSDIDSISSSSSDQSIISEPSKLSTQNFSESTNQPHRPSSTIPATSIRPLTFNASSIIDSSNNGRQTPETQASRNESVSGPNLTPNGQQLHVARSDSPYVTNLATSRLDENSAVFSKSSLESGSIDSKAIELEDDDDTDGLVSGTLSNQALIGPESGEERGPQIRTLRPVQVRRMPFLFHLLMILSISMIGFGSYAGYDAVAAVQVALTKDLSLSPTQFGMLYSVYALPNVILVIFGGKLVDIWGVHVVGLITTALISIGAVLVALAPSLGVLGLKGRFAIMLIGRFIFGVGAESSYVVQNSMCVKWFFGDHLATAMSITVAFTRLGSICSFLAAPGLAARSNYTLALWAAAGACVLSFLAVFAYMGLRSYAKKYLLSESFDVNSLEIANDVEASPRLDRQSVEMQVLDNSVPDEPLEHEDAELDLLTTGNCLTKGMKKTWHHVKNLSVLFWGCAFLAMFSYGISLGFRAVSSEPIADRYHMKPTQANMVLASLDITGLFASPILGWLVDFTYQMGWITLAGNVLSVLTFLVLIPTISPYFGVVLLGLSSTVIPATIYPAISYMIPPHLEGFAFGITSSVINLGNLIFNYIIGRALDAGWIYMCYLLIGLSVISVAITLWWMIKDSKSENPVLNRPRDWSAERRWIRHRFPFLSC